MQRNLFRWGGFAAVVIVAGGLLGFCMSRGPRSHASTAAEGPFVPSGGVHPVREAGLKLQDAPGILAVAPASPASQAGTVAATRSVEEVREQRIRELEDLGMEDDPASLAAILAELKNPDPEIRAAALEAAIQFGDRTTTLPFLKELLLVTEDPEERRAIREAIEFIALPSILEVMELGRKDVAPQTVSERPSDLGSEGDPPEAAP